MKKSVNLLKTGFIALAITCIGTAGYSQGAEKKPGRKDVQTQSSSIEQTSAVKQTTPAFNKKNSQGVAIAELDASLASQKRGAVTATAPGNSQRKCTPQSTLKPFSITRENFNNLQADRQAFLLNNLHKYTIVD